MARYLVTGRAGSGKTAVTQELKRRGFVAFDSDDVPELSTWWDTATNKPVIIRDNSYVDLSRYRWVWDDSVLQNLLEQHTDIFLCGGAHNDLEFTNRFDASFVLDVHPSEQIKRLQMRSNNDYGRDPAMHGKILANQRNHLAAALKLNAHRIDANQPIENVVDDILGYCHVAQ